MDWGTGFVVVMVAVVIGVAGGGGESGVRSGKGVRAQR